MTSKGLEEDDLTKRSLGVSFVTERVKDLLYSCKIVIVIERLWMIINRSRFTDHSARSLCFGTIHYSIGSSSQSLVHIVASGNVWVKLTQVILWITHCLTLFPAAGVSLEKLEQKCDKRELNSATATAAEKASVQIKVVVLPFILLFPSTQVWIHVFFSIHS